MTLSTKELLFHGQQPWRPQSSIAHEINIAGNPPRCLLICAHVTWYIVRGPRKRYNFILKRPFFTRFALILCRAPRETSKNINTDLAGDMDKATLKKLLV